MEYNNTAKPKNKQTKEEIALSEFKTRISDLMKPEYDDVYLRKWLKARNFDVGKAEQMFRTSIAYKAKMKAETLLTDYQPPEVLRKYLPGGFAGMDKEGSPIWIELYGYMDSKGLLSSARKSDIEKTKLQVGERIMQLLDQQTRKLQKPIEGMTVIVDLDNVGPSLLWGPAMQMIAHMGKVTQDNYPEVVKRSFIVNAPRIFPLLWRMIRPLLSEDMKRKVCILGSDYKKELLQHIDADQLPAFLGGSMTDPDGDPMCPSRICKGGKVPEEYFLEELLSTDRMQTVSVPRSDKLELRYQVQQKGSLLRWEFKTDGYDIGFGVFYEGVDGRVPVITAERVSSHLLPEDGAHTCHKLGPYVLVFDNSYSWARSKSIRYNVEIIPPEDTILLRDIDLVTKGGSWARIAEKTETTHL